jgi:two pore calcium channel protein
MILFYGWFGVVMFYGTEQGKRDFSNLMEGCWTMWQCVTTVNYPDVMMPSYNDSRLTGIFWVSFMVISFFFLMNLILASAVNAYEEVINDRKKTRKAIATENLTEAFELMDRAKTGQISRDTIMALFLVLSQDFPELRKLKGDEAKLLFGFLDKDGSAAISLEEFQDFGKVFLLEFTLESDYVTYVQRHHPKMYASSAYQRLCAMVRSTEFEYVVDFILLLNAVVIGIQSYPELSGQSVEFNPHFSDGYIDTVWELMETVFTCLYLLEALLKIMVNGWKKYSEDMRNMFDFVITVMAVLATAYVYYPNAYSDSRLIRFVVMARVLRLGRILIAIPAFQSIGTIAAEIFPAAIHVFTVLLFLMYGFAALGMILYGGLITRDPSNPLSMAILGNDFSDNDYWANNFNDMMSGMNVLFNLLVINNWTNCEIGFEAVTGGKWVRLYFLAFYIFGVILIDNLVIAFIINAFFQQLATLQTRLGSEVVEGEAIIHGEGAHFDASKITGTDTGITGGYIARIRARHADVEIDEREGLRRLFTQQSSDISSNGNK